MADPICVIGDSITEGVIYSSEKQRYTHLEDCFVRLLSGALGCEVHNRSKFGCTLPAALARMDRYEADIRACPRTLVMLGGNDSDFDWPAVAETPDAPHDCNTPPETFAAQYGRLLDRILVLGSEPVVMNLIPVDGAAYYRWFSRRADPAALMRYLHSTASIEHWNEFYSLTVTRIAAERGLPLLDARSAFLRRQFFDGLYCEDGIHPSPAGHRALFEYLLPQAKRVFL